MLYLGYGVVLHSFFELFYRFFRNWLVRLLLRIFCCRNTSLGKDGKVRNMDAQELEHKNCDISLGMLHKFTKGVHEAVRITVHEYAHQIVYAPTALGPSARVYVTFILTHGDVFILTHAAATRKFRLESKSDPSAATANTSVEPSRTLRTSAI